MTAPTERTTGYDPRAWYSLDEANAYRDGYDDAMEHAEARAIQPALDARAIARVLHSMYRANQPFGEEDEASATMFLARLAAEGGMG